MLMVQQAASLGLDSQVKALLAGGPLERTIARIVVRGALKAVDNRARLAARYQGQAFSGHDPGT